MSLPVFLHAEAPLLPLAAPAVELLADERHDGLRELRLRVRSQRGLVVTKARY
jgi:hypothetical protein